VKAWSGKSHGGFFFFLLFRGVLEVSAPSRQQSRNKGCVWFQVGVWTAGAHYAGAAGAAFAAAVSAREEQGEKTRCAAWLDRAARVPVPSRGRRERVALGWFGSFLVGCVPPDPPSPLEGVWVGPILPPRL